MIFTGKWKLRCYSDHQKIRWRIKRLLLRWR